MAIFKKLFGKKEESVKEVFEQNNAHALSNSNSERNKDTKRKEDIRREQNFRRTQIVNSLKKVYLKLQSIDSKFAKLGDQINDITFKYQTMNSDISANTLEVIDNLMNENIKYLENYINRENYGAAMETVYEIDGLVNDIVSGNPMFTKSKYYVSIIKKNSLKIEVENLLSQIQQQRKIKNDFSRQYNSSTSNHEKKDLLQRVNAAKEKIDALTSLLDRLRIKLENIDMSIIAFKENAINNEVVNIDQYEDLLEEALKLANESIESTKLDEELNGKLKKMVNYQTKKNLTVDINVYNDEPEMELPDKLEVDD